MEGKLDREDFSFVGKAERSEFKDCVFHVFFSGGRIFRSCSLLKNSRSIELRRAVRNYKLYIFNKKSIALADS